MDRCALFVDAGYLLSDGAMAVHGTRRREDVSWDHSGLLERLNSLARERTGLPVLRCYWYEATVEGRRTPEHDTLADLPGLKLRLARIRPGRREGVDAQVHRDLMTLARNSAICDAVVVSGDEDLTQVVCDAQELGIRVTVMQVAADGSWSVSRALRQECDDLIEIGAAELRPYVTLTPAAESGAGGSANELTTSSTPELTSGRTAERTAEPADHPALQPLSAASHGDQAPPAGGAYQPNTDQQGAGPYAPVPSGQSAEAHDPGSGRTGPSITGSSSPSPYAVGTGGYATPPADTSGVRSGASTPGGGQGGAPLAPGVYSAPQAPGAPTDHHGGPGGQQPMGPQGGNRGSSATPAMPALPSYADHSPEPQQPALPPSPVPNGPLPAPTSPNGPHAQHHLQHQNGGMGGGYTASHTPYGGPQQAPVPPQQATSGATTIDDAVKAAHKEGHDFGESVARDAPALWLEAVLARKPRMPSDLEARLLQGSSLPIDFLLHDEVRHALRRGFWDALERARY